MKANKTEISNALVISIDNYSFDHTNGNTLPFEENSLIKNFDAENEVEVETDTLPTLDVTSNNYNLSPYHLFLNEYSAHSFIILKVEFLDIFSPPPNC